ncbi:unnamed protein product [Prorocentrum cordatum]|uniref:RNase H type-1 domain-containing protein n=1 Tax=Prorocentrum cordatum TaxID=2364126 RepID=A0ABN9R8K2_9DINO|nr:unnamed protein product [Polarella glacialis]
MSKRDGAGLPIIRVNSTSLPLSCLRTEGAKRGGILAASIYLDKNHLGESSWSVLRDLGRALRASGRSFVVGGDFNVGPDIFTDKARCWLEGVRGQVVSNFVRQGTCFFAKDAPPSELDFYIASLDLAHRTRSCKIIDDPCCRPLAEARGREAAGEAPGCTEALFPREKPVGPAQEAPQVDAEVRASCEMACSQDELARAFLGIIGHVEEELLQVFHIDPEDAHKMPKAVSLTAPLAPPAARAAWADAMEAEANALTDAFRSSQARGFADWSARSMRAGGGAVHAYRRGPQGWLPDEIVDGAPVGGQDRVDAVARFWSQEVWTLKDAAAAATPTLRPPTGPSMARPSLERARRAAKQLARRTGAGADQFSPRLIVETSDPCIECRIDLGIACERLERFPSAARLVHLVMLLKPAGGFRPIGRLTWPPRWRARVRQEESRAWEAQLLQEKISNFWGGQGKAAEGAIWRQALHNEDADGRGLCSGGALLDLWNAREGYPLALTAAALSIYEGPKRIVLDGIVSEAFLLATGLVAGRGHAGRLPRRCMAIIDAEHRRMYKEVPLAITFDDCSLRMAGTEASDIGAVVSRGKSEILDSSDKLRCAIELNVGEGVQQVRGSSKVVGMKLTNSGLKPVAIYGIACMAWPTKAPLGWRSRLAAVAFGTGAGRSISLSYLVSPRPWDDPLFDHIVKPIVAWAKGLQLALASDRRALGSALAAACGRLGASGAEDLAGRGPAAAAVLAAVRLGWGADHTRRWTDDPKRPIDMGVSGAGELLAAAETLAHSLPPVHMHSDSQLMLDGWEAGEDWCVCWNRPYSESWQFFWSRARDAGCENIHISKVKGHASMNDVHSGVITLWQRQGNRLAGASAKQGASVHPFWPAHAEAATVAAEWGVGLGRWAGVAAQEGDSWLRAEDGFEAPGLSLVRCSVEGSRNAS